MAAGILAELEVRSICLLTNNPDKIEGLRRLGVDVRSRLPLQTQATEENAGYLRTKALRMHHMLFSPATESPQQPY